MNNLVIILQIAASSSLKACIILRVINFIFQVVWKQEYFQSLRFLLKGSHLAKWEQEQDIYPLPQSHPDDVSNRWLLDTPLSIASQPALVTEGRRETGWVQGR